MVKQQKFLGPAWISMPCLAFIILFYLISLSDLPNIYFQNIKVSGVMTEYWMALSGLMAIRIVLENAVIEDVAIRIINRFAFVMNALTFIRICVYVVMAYRGITID